MFAAGVRMPYIIAAFTATVGGAWLVILKNPERMGRINALFDLESDRVSPRRWLPAAQWDSSLLSMVE